MQINLLDGNQTTIRVSGNIELPEVDDLRMVINDVAERSPAGFVIDMSDVQYIDSAGISALIFAYRKVCTSGGQLALVVKNRNVRRVLDLTRLETLPGMHICEDADSAVRVIQK